MVESALGYLETTAKTGFDQTVISLKASDVPTTIEAYRLIAGQVPHPLHLGVTAAGPLESGLIKGAIGVGTLLAEGLGDTVRISLTADPWPRSGWPGTFLKFCICVHGASQS